jgi:hypothetical protein
MPHAGRIALVHDLYGAKARIGERNSLVSPVALDVPFARQSRRGALSTKLLVGILAFATACGPHRTGTGGPDGGGDDNGGDAATCASSKTKADQIPLDLYVMLDQSGSMGDTVAGGGTKWQSVTSALTAFVQQPGLTGISVGLQYFAVAGAASSCTVALCNNDNDCGAGCGPCVIPIPGLPGGCTGFNPGGDSCKASDYATAAVEIAPLPGAATNIVTSMGQHSPTTGTPTSAALQGAIDHSKSWAGAHAGDAVAVIFATDGDPSECDTTLSDIDNIASMGFNTAPKVPTFVIGVGPSSAALNGIAAAGGSQMAFLVDTGGNVQQQFLAAMNAIRHAALGCSYSIPLPTDGSPPDYSKVNVIYTPGGGGPPVTIPYVMSKAMCPAAPSNGWYYDNPASPMQILLCDSTCGTVEADSMGEIDIELGCSTVIF